LWKTTRLLIAGRVLFLKEDRGGSIVGEDEIKDFIRQDIRSVGHQGRGGEAWSEAGICNALCMMRGRVPARIGRLHLQAFGEGGW